MALCGILRQSTAVDILFGPCIDDADGKTAETGLTLDVEVSKNGQGLANKNDATAPVHDAGGTVDGYYNCELDETDTDTIGILTVVAHAAGFLPVRQDYQVIDEVSYDALFAAGATDYLPVDVTQWATAAVHAVATAGVPYVDVHNWLGAAAPAMTGDAYARLGAPAGASVSADVAAIKSETADILTDTATIDTAGEIAAAVWNADATTYQTQGTFGQAIGDPVTDANTIYKAVVTDAVGATVGVDVVAVKAKTDLISTDVVSANPAYMHDPIVDQSNIVVAQVGLIRNKPSANPIQIAEITTPGLIKVWRYRKGTDTDWTLIVAGGGMAAAIGGVYYQYTFPSASWATGDLILYEIYNTVVTLGTEVFTLSTVQGYGMVGTADSLAAIKAKTDNLPSGIPKNVALSNFPFFMVLSSDHISPATGKTVTVQISKDAGAFANSSNSPVEISNGWYQIDLTQTEMNASTIALKCTATDCDATNLSLVTST